MRRILGLALVVALFVPISLVAQKGKATPPLRWEVVDANGKTVGVAVDIQLYSALVLLPGPDGQAVPVKISQNEWSGAVGASGALYYRSTDCSGQPYINNNDGVSDLLAVSAGKRNSPLWLQSGPAEVFAPGSVSDVVSSTCNIVQQVPGDPSMVQGVPATATTLMDEFVLPFSIRLVR